MDEKKEVTLSEESQAELERIMLNAYKEEQRQKLQAAKRVLNSFREERQKRKNNNGKEGTT